MSKSNSLLFDNPGTLRCNNSECPGTLCYLTKEHQSSLKGTVVLYCGRCGLKHFAGSQQELRDRAAYEVTLVPRLFPVEADSPVEESLEQLLSA